MFYSNEVYISNICSARELENKDARFSNTSVLMVKRALDWSPSKFETNYNF